MKQNWLVKKITPFLLWFVLPGCYFADAVFLEPTPPKVSLQKDSERSVEKYIRKRSGSLSYTSFGFTPLTVHVPEEIVVLEEIEANRREGFISGPEIDSVIRAKRNYLEANQIQRTVHLDHLYTLEGSSKTITVLESEFILNDTLGVMDFKPLLFCTIPDSLEQALNYYIYEYTLFASSDITESRRLSNRFYYFFKQHQESIEDLEIKSNFFKHALIATHFVLKRSEFNPNEFVQWLTIQFNHNAFITNSAYTPVEFSPLYEKSLDGKITGYYIFHKFNLEKVDTSTLHAVEIHFSKHYEFLLQTYLEEPFDHYFN